MATSLRGGCGKLQAGKLASATEGRVGKMVRWERKLEQRRVGMGGSGGGSAGGHCGRSGISF